MRRAVTVLALAAALALAVARPASAASRDRHRFPFTAQVVMHPVLVDQLGRYLVRGDLTATGLPAGQVLYLATISGQTVTAPILGRFPGGTLHGFTRGTLVPSTRARIVNEIDGTGRVSGGTGMFRGARGRFSFTGESHDDGTVVMTLTGVIVNPRASRAPAPAG